MKNALFIPIILIYPLTLQAEVITDGTLGTATSLPGPDYLIEDSLGQQFGRNLFHSLQTFNLKSGESATFTGPDSIANILTRVTGGKRSFLDGTIRSQIPDANLYLLNPSGILFGENASLDIAGSFHASTADYVRLGENGRFSARHPNQSLLTVAPPEAFGFLEHPNTIRVEGSYLQVPTTQTLSFVSGDIHITDGESKAATLYAPDGRINLIAVASTSEVMATDTDFAPFEKLGKISLSHAFGKRRVNEHLPEIYGELKHANVDVSGEGGGQIVMRAGEFSMRNSSLFADTYGDKNNAAIDLFIDGEMHLIDGSKIAMNNVAGNSDQGDLKIIATLGLKFSGFFNAEPFDEPISAITTANIYSSGKGADIDIQAPQIDIAPGIIQTSTLSDAEAGNIKIDAQQVKLQGIMQNEVFPASINTGTAGSGNAGNITINAKNIIDLSYFSSLSASTDEGSSGAAGNIRLSTQHLRLTDAGEISSFSYGYGDAGSIDITANTASFSHNGNIVTEAFNASGGEIHLQITDRFSMVKSVITTEVQGDESDDHAGDITLNKPALFTLNQSEIFAKANVGNGGNIQIIADNFIPSSDSLLNASSKLGIDGKVHITAGEENFSNSLVVLTKTMIDAAHLLLKSCVESARDDSYFVTVGRIPEQNIAKMLKSPQPPFFKDGLPQSERLARYHSLQTALSTASASEHRSEILGQLAALYANEQRYQEALQLNQQALDQIALLNAPYSHYKLQWQRGRLFKALGEYDNAIIAYQAAIQKLTPIRQHLSQIYHDRYPNGERTEFRQILKPLFTELVGLLLTLSEPLQNDTASKWLKTALQTMDQLKTAELQDYFQDECTKPTTDLEKVDQQHHTAIIYPIFLSKQVKLLISLPDKQRLLKTVSGTPKQLTETINSLASQLSCRTKACRADHSYRFSAQKLYDWLIRPLEPVLLSTDIHTLVFVPDGPLYSIPMAVLHDGQQFLIEKYALAIAPSLTIPKSTNQRVSPKLLYSVLTASKVPYFPPIKNFATPMQNALDKIFDSITTLKGQNFIRKNLEQALHSPHSIIHVFSHAQFSSNVSDTFIVTYNEKLNMNQLEKLIAPMQHNQVPLELLALSACQSATGDERAALGLAGVAYKAGARSAIAALWPVREAVAYQLFNRFYEAHINKQQPKAQALQQAQRMALNRWQHPHYWSGFLLIGDWL